MRFVGLAMSAGRVVGDSCLLGCVGLCFVEALAIWKGLGRLVGFGVQVSSRGLG